MEPEPTSSAAPVTEIQHQIKSGRSLLSEKSRKLYKSLIERDITCSIESQPFEFN